MPPDPRLGRVINNRYRIVAPLGSGGMASVYLAEQLGIGGEVAIKFLRTDMARDQRFLRRFEVEARALARIDHPHCVSVRDFGVADVPYIVMPRVDGPTLYDELKKGPMPAGRTIAIMRQLLAALGHAHERGIIHRDIKPENVKVQQDTRDHVRLLDFGLAKLRRPPAGMPPTNPLIAVGTPSYMSPEQFVRGGVDARSDIYSSGALLFELLTGRKPFEFERIVDACRMHTTWPRPRLRSTAPSANFSEELEEVVVRAMALSPDDRFQNTEEFREALDAVPEASALGRATGARRAVATTGAEGLVPASEPAPTTTVPAAGRRNRKAQLRPTMKLRPMRERRGSPVAKPRDGGLAWLLALLVVAALGIAAIEVPAVRNFFQRFNAPADGDSTAAAKQAPAPPISDELDDPAEELLQRADEAMQRSDWNEAMRLCARAVERDPSLLESDDVYEHALAALGSKSGRRAATRFIEGQLGSRAIPYLESAADDGEPRRLRRRARRLLQKLK